MMRRVVWGLVWVGILWCAWWAFAAFSLSGGVQAWFEDRRAEGWLAELSSTSVSGFPARVETTLDAPALADPATGLAIEAPQLTLGARTIWPGDMFVDLPSAPITVATPQGRGSVVFDTGRAELDLHPGRRLELERMEFSAGAFGVTVEDGGLFGGEGLSLGFAQNIETAEIYGLSLRAEKFQPGATVRASLGIPSDWPIQFDALNINASLTFDRPWDLRALEDRRPQPRRIALHQARALWGELEFHSVGDLMIDEVGRPSGKLNIKAQNWEAMLDIAQRAGLLPSDIRPMVENVFRSLSSNTGRTNQLDVTLTFEDGLVRVGFLPLGPAPRIVLR